MKTRMRKPGPHPSPTKPSTAPTAPPIPPLDWAMLERCNDLDSGLRARALAEMGMESASREVLGILTKSHFVIPGKTRYECQHCGECCRYARKVAQLTYEPCPFLTADNHCAKHDANYLVCQWFPFWVYPHPRLGGILTIKPYCSGYGKGPLVDYAQTIRRLDQLAAAEAENRDGAFVIHEVLTIPGRKDWGFPSKENIDALMRYLSDKTTPAERSPHVPSGIERLGEVHFAHTYTSGLLGGVGSPLFTVDRDGRITDANEPLARLFERDRADIVGHALPSFFVNPEKIAASLRVCFSHGKKTASPHRLRLTDDRAVPVLMDGLSYRDRSDGMVHGLILCLNPTSPAVYHEIRQSREYARGLLEASLDALMVIDKDNAIIDVNQAVIQISGRARDTLVGLPFQTLFTDPARANQGVQRTFGEGTVRDFELTLQGPSGEPIQVSFNAAVYRDSEGVVQGIFAVARDIREQLKLTQSIKDAQTYSRGLIECCLDLMVTIDRDGIITDANRAASDITGQPRERIIGAAFRTFFDNPARADAGVARTFADGEVRDYQMNLITGKGPPMSVAFNATPYRDGAGQVKGIFAIARPKC